MEVFPHPVRTAWKLLASLRIDNPGITLAECGTRLGYSVGAISSWLKLPLYQSFENFLIEKRWDNTPLPRKLAAAEVKEEIDEFAQEMLGRLRDIVERSNDDKLVASIGQDMLDRAGYGELKREGQRSIQFILTPETLAMLSRRTSEIGDSAEVVVGEVVALPSSQLEG